MTQFSIEEYKKNPNRKVVTRIGDMTRIVCTDANSIDNGEVIALINYKGEERTTMYLYSASGRLSFTKATDVDLFFAPREHWANAYKANGTEDILMESDTYESREAAIEEWDKHDNTGYTLLSTVLVYREED